MVKLGGVSLSTPVILAPMAGISSYPYRMLNRTMGFEFAYSEMISARALSYSNRRTIEMLRTVPEDRPLGVQLLGKDPYYILKALEKLRDYSFDVLDFNAACPQKKITNNEKGAYLLKEPKKLSALLKRIVENISKPVTLKMRLGWDNSNDAVKIALLAQDVGVSAVCVHGRTKMQDYRKGVDYAAIARVKKALNIPVIGSGDVFNATLAKKMFTQTGVDIVSVARGALGNPWIFKEITEFLDKGRVVSSPTIDEISEMMDDHLTRCVEFYGEKVGVRKFRKFYIWYTRAFIRVKPLRFKIAKVKAKLEMNTLIKTFVRVVKETGRSSLQ
jgi:nifR3 family TIM-barrel protein